MSLTSDQRRKWVIEKIVSNFENYPEISNRAWYEIDANEADPSPKTQRDIVEKILNVFEAIKITSRKESQNGKDTDTEKTNWYDIEIVSPKFDDLCKKHGVKFERRINEKDCHYISVREDRTITLNDKYRLSRPILNSENDLFFLYVFNNPDKKIRVEEIEKDANKTVGKNIGNTLNDLGFKNEIRKLFFLTNKDTVIFRNFIPKDRLGNFGINQENLKKQISKLKKL